MPIKLIDGNGGSDQATIKPGSTAAVAADKPLVITVHPSSVALPSSISGTVTVTGPLTDTQLRAIAVPVSGTVTANAGTGPFPVSDNSGSLTIDSTQLPAALAANGGLKIEGVASGVAVPVSNTQLPAALVGGRLDENVGAWLGSTTPSVGQKTMAASLPVALASDQTTVATSDTATLVDNAGFTDGTSRVMAAGFIFDESAGTALTENDVGAARVTVNRAQVMTIEDSATRGVRTTVKAASTAAVASDPALVVTLSPNNAPALPATATTPTVASVVANAASVQLYASNASARQRTTRNDSTTATLYLGEGVAATVVMPIAIAPGQTYEHVTPLFTGTVNGIWSSAVGNARTREAT